MCLDIMLSPADLGINEISRIKGEQIPISIIFGTSWPRAVVGCVLVNLLSRIKQQRVA